MGWCCRLLQQQTVNISVIENKTALWVIEMCRLYLKSSSRIVILKVYVFYFRLYVISQLPKLKVLDDTTIKAEERELAAKTYERRRARRDNSSQQ